jgi:hypothetical protein
MWIAKPIHALTQEEKDSWLALEQNLPLSQTLNWAGAIEAISGQSYLVFSPDEKVGGLVFGIQDSPGAGIRFECVNGPHLHWDNPQVAPRQFATFAMAVAQLSKRFHSLSLRPRWESHLTETRLRSLPIAPFAQTRAATSIVALQKTKKAQFDSLTQRMRRTLATTWKHRVETHWQKVTPELLDHFVPKMIDFGASRGFTVPPQSWFQTLMLPTNSTSRQPPRFFIATSKKSLDQNVDSSSQILVCIHGNKAYYLFGHETRNAQLKASVSTSASAHFESLLQCSAEGAHAYDLNGYLVNTDPAHPYYGVCRFKDQFAGKVVQYDVPEFVIN